MFSFSNRAFFFSSFADCGRFPADEISEIKEEAKKRTINEYRNMIEKGA